jgi:hypothetical protein
MGRDDDNALLTQSKRWYGREWMRGEPAKPEKQGCADLQGWKRDSHVECTRRRQATDLRRSTLTR